MALQDQDPDFGLLGEDEADLMDQPFIPPRSNSFRTARYPGFWSPGADISVTPNPLAGNAPEAALAAGETGIPVAPSGAAQSQASTGFREIQPNLVQGGGTSIDEKQANTINDVRSAGMITDPEDAIKAINIGTSLISPTGIAGLIASEAAIAAGIDPLGLGSSFQMDSNINKRPGYSQAFDDALADAKKRGLKGLAAGNDALKGAAGLTDPGSNMWGSKYGGTEERTAPTAAPAVDVTAANKVTGFAKAPAAPAPASTGAGTTTAPSGAGTPTAPTAPLSPTLASTAPAKTGGGAGSSGAGKGGVGSIDSSGKGGGFGSNPDQRGFAEGGTITRPAVSQIQHGDIGEAVEEEPMPAMPTPAPMAAEDQMPAAVDPKYAPPPELVADDGQVDNVPVNVDEGEVVIKRESAQKYSPEELKMINEDPEMVIAAIEAYEGEDEPYEGEQDADYYEAEAGVSDDNSGLGAAGPVSRRMPPTDPRIRLP
jgi:hypothetical protein